MAGTRARYRTAIPDQTLKNHDPAGTGVDARYVVGDLEIDPAGRHLRRLHGGTVHLARRPFQVLLHLVVNRRRLVTRAELFDRFWDGHDVYDDALTRSISSVRKAIGDNGRRPRLIETRWREGYRFVGPCEEQGGVRAPAGESPSPDADGAGGAPTDETREALAVVGAIYDAALNPEHWPATLEGITAFVGGVAAALTSQNVVTRQGRFQYSWGDNPHYTRLYFERYVGLNPCLVPLMLLGTGEVCSASTLLPTERFRTTRFYREWAAPQGYGDSTAAIIEKTPTVVTFLGVSHRDEDSPVGRSARQRMALLVPHVRRAVAIGSLLEGRRIEADALADTIDAIAAGVFLISADGHVIHANAAGRAMLQEGVMLRIEESRLVACGGEEHRTLAAMIASAAAGGVVVGRRGIAVPLRTSSRDRYVAHVLPLTFGRDRNRRNRGNAATAVFVHKAGLEGLLPLEALAQEFGLTAAELRVLVALIEVGGRVSDIAPVLALAGSTVRTHLRRLFEKTGTTRQADLVRIVAGYASPLRPPS